MALEQLDPDALELRIASHTGVLLPCPFCGRHPLMVSAVNHVERGGEPLSIYQAKIFCDYRCNAQVLQNERSREQAQQSAMDQWNHRVPTAANNTPSVRPWWAGSRATTPCGRSRCVSVDLRRAWCRCAVAGSRCASGPASRPWSSSRIRSG